MSYAIEYELRVPYMTYLNVGTDYFTHFSYPKTGKTLLPRRNSMYSTKNPRLWKNKKIAEKWVEKIMNCDDMVLSAKVIEWENPK